MAKKESELIQEAIQKPFKDYTKLLIGAALSLVPILNFIPMGYAVKNAKTPKKLPEFDYVNDFILGLKLSVVSLVYLAVPVVVAALLWVADYRTVGTALGALVGLLLIIPAIRSSLELGRTESLSAALDINRMLQESYSAKFLKTVVGVLLIGVGFGIVSTLVANVQLIGWIAAALLEFAGAVAVWSYAGSTF